MMVPGDGREQVSTGEVEMQPGTDAWFTRLAAGSGRCWCGHGRNTQYALKSSLTRTKVCMNGIVIPHSKGQGVAQPAISPRIVGLCRIGIRIQIS